MDLCNAIQTESLDVIKALITKEDFTTDPEWLDYKALNSAIKCGRKDVVQVLLDRNCRVNTTWKFPIDTPLHNAVYLADQELVCELLERKAFIAVSNTDGNSPLHLAFLRKQEKIVDVMLDYIKKYSIFSNSKNNQGLTHLHIACTRSNAEAIKGFLTNGASARDSISNDSILWPGFNAFHFAAEFKSTTAMKVLLRHSTIVGLRAGSKPNGFGKTPLQMINQELEKPSVMASLLMPKGFSSFHMACVGEDSKLVKSFLDNNIDVNKLVFHEQFCTFYSPLHFATKSKNSENAELLLEHGADADCRNEDEMTPVQLALYNERSDSNDKIIKSMYDATENKANLMPDKNGLNFMHVACSTNDLSTVKQFLDEGVEIDCQVTYERQRLYHYTPLHFAIKYGHLDMAKYLVERGADVNCGEDCVDGTPLHLACKVGHLGLIDFLLESGAEVDAARPYDRKTPLHLIVKCCLDQRLDFNVSTLTCISKFIKLGVDVNAQDVNGDTVLHVACSKIYGHPRDYDKCLELLLENGADINIENSFGLTPFNCQMSEFWIGDHVQSGHCMILYRHVQKLDASRLAVNPKNIVCCERLIGKRIVRSLPEPEPPKSQPDRPLDLQEEELARKRQWRVDEMKRIKSMNSRQQRIREIERMKNVKLTSEVSLNDFLHLEPERAKDLLSSDAWIQVLKEDFPVYGNYLRMHYQRAFNCIGVGKEDSNKRKTKDDSKTQDNSKTEDDSNRRKTEDDGSDEGFVLVKRRRRK